MMKLVWKYFVSEDIKNIYFFVDINNKRGYPLLLIMNSKQQVEGSLGHEM